MDQIPDISGINKLIGGKDGTPASIAVGKLKGIGSAASARGAVGLYHVENVTPEAIAHGHQLLTGDHKT